MILVSACLTGRRCRYDGNDNRDDEIACMAERGEALPFCPEEAGGLETPRAPVELKNGRAFTRDGYDVTDAFTRGAEAALDACSKHHITKAILKARSPSCGCGEIYDGSFTHTVVAGDGITAALLKANGIEVQAR